MLRTLMYAALIAGVTVGAHAQQPADAAATQKSTAAPATQGQLDADTPIKDIAASDKGRTTLNKNLPGLLTHPAYDQFKGMSLRALAPLSGGLITEEKISAVEADLNTGK